MNRRERAGPGRQEADRWAIAGDEGGGRGVTAEWVGISFWGDGLVLDRGDDCTTL